MSPPRYTLRQLSYFVAAARAGSIAGAATAEQVSRSAVAAAINELEAAFDVSLAARSRGTGFELTATGRQVFELAISLLRDADELTEHVVRGGLTGSLSIGAMPSLGPTVFPFLYEELAKHHPDLRLDVRSLAQPDVLAALHAGELDLAVVYGGPAGHDLGGVAVYDVTMHVIVSGMHPLAARERVRAVDLANERLILMTMPPAPDNSIDYFTQCDLTPNVWVRVDNFELMRSLVARGLGVALCMQAPRTRLSYEGQAVVARQLDPAPTPDRLSVVWPHGRRLSRAAEHVVRLLRDRGAALAPRVG